MTTIIEPDGSKRELNSRAAPREAGAPHEHAASLSQTASVQPSINPSESPEARRERIKEELRRTAMNLPLLKMQVPEVTGWRFYWMNDVAGRIAAALRMGYMMVKDEEVKLHDFSLAGDSTKTGNQDMGTNVSMVVGSDEYGQPMRAYLMKIDIERYAIAQELAQERNDAISAALRKGRIGTVATGAHEALSEGERDLPIPKVVEISRRDQVVAPANRFQTKLDI